MSTKGTKAMVEIVDNGFHAQIHAYTECMEDPPVQNLYFTMWQQGYFDNHAEMTLAVPVAQALKFCKALGAWATNHEKWLAELAARKQKKGAEP